LRKYGEKFIITPSKASVRSLIDKARMIIKANLGHRTLKMIEELNAVIRGWANYYRYVCSKATFAYADSIIYRNLWKWAKRRNKNKGKRWLWKHYFRTVGSCNWSFFATVVSESCESMSMDLLKASMIKIVRHIKIRAEANPYAERWQKYFHRRLTRKYYAAIPYTPY
jgi:RNA-directed DNA polymerase